MESNVRPRRLRWLVGIHISAAACTFVLVPWIPDRLCVCCVSLIVAQTGSLGSFFALRARQRWAWLPLTVAMTLFAAGLVAALFTIREGFHPRAARELADLSGLLGLLYAVVGVALGWARRRGWRLVAQPVAAEGPAQFALRRLFAVTLAVSLLLAIRGSLLATRTGEVVWMASAFVGLAASVLLAVWIALPTGAVWPRLILASAVVGGVMLEAVDPMALTAMAAVLLVGGTFLIVLISLLVVRWAGYRLVRCPAKTRLDSTPPAGMSGPWSNDRDCGV
jgi:hypothetical protein